MYELISAFATQKFAVFESKFLLECYSQGPKRSPITKFYKLFEYTLTSIKQNAFSVQNKIKTEKRVIYDIENDCSMNKA